jgi:putative oxidoreductase
MHDRIDIAAYGIALLRISLGVVFIAHGLYLKLFVFTLPGTAAFFELGLPGFMAYATFAAETAGGLALVLGVQTRIAAAALLPVALGAVWAHSGAGWLFTNEGGGWEYPLFLAAATGAQLMLGTGTLALRVPGRSPAPSRTAGQTA